ncbi:MAG: hypothetical protein J0M02_02100 [Planctomycetes bacterium]|nr:hypothetical protein [Planctomycetota bacterium]
MAIPYDRLGGTTIASFTGERSYAAMDIRLLRFPSRADAEAALASIEFYPLGSRSPGYKPATAPTADDNLGSSVFTRGGVAYPLEARGTRMFIAKMIEIRHSRGIQALRRQFEYDCSTPFLTDVQLPDNLRVGDCLVTIGSSVAGNGNPQLRQQEDADVRRKQGEVSAAEEKKRKSLPMEPLRCSLTTWTDELPIETSTLSISWLSGRGDPIITPGDVAIHVDDKLRAQIKAARTHLPPGFPLSVNVNGFLRLEIREHQGSDLPLPEDDFLASVSTLRSDQDAEAWDVLAVMLRRGPAAQRCLDPAGRVYGMVEPVPKPWNCSLEPGRVVFTYPSGAATYSLRLHHQRYDRSAVSDLPEAKAPGVRWKTEQWSQMTNLIANEAPPEGGMLLRCRGIAYRPAPGGDDACEVHAWDMDLAHAPADFLKHYRELLVFISHITTIRGGVKAVTAAQQ